MFRAGLVIISNSWSSQQRLKAKCSSSSSSNNILLMVQKIQNESRNTKKLAIYFLKLISGILAHYSRIGLHYFEQYSTVT